MYHLHHAHTHTHTHTDEVGAIVLDIGSYTARAGYAGEDTPKVRELLVWSIDRVQVQF